MDIRALENGIHQCDLEEVVRGVVIRCLIDHSQKAVPIAKTFFRCLLGERLRRFHAGDFFCTSPMNNSWDTSKYLQYSEVGVESDPGSVRGWKSKHVV